MKKQLIFNVDARSLHSTVPSNLKVQSTITSPPYFDMKDYGCDNQIGYGQRYDEYLRDLQDVFKQVLSITKSDGTLWIVIDTFKRNDQVVTLPFDLASKLKDIGWYLQEIIIWKKDKTVPWSSNGFMQRKFEYILFFSKSAKYKYNKDRARIFDTQQLKKWWVKYPERYNPKGKALNGIWEFPIPVQGSWGKEYIRHFCPLPKEMVATMIEISTDEDDIVLDPFSGSGAVLSQAAYMGRGYVGFELNPDYIKMFSDYLSKTLEKGKEEYKLLGERQGQMEFANMILDLRALKYAKLLVKGLKEKFKGAAIKIFVSHCFCCSKGTTDIPAPNQYYFVIISKLDKLNLSEQVKTLTGTKLFKKFNINPKLKYRKHLNVISDNLYGYSEKNTHSYVKNANLSDPNIKIISDIKLYLKESDFE